MVGLSSNPRHRRHSSAMITTIGLDLAKSVFPGYAVGEDGRVVFCRQLRRNQTPGFSGKRAPCLIGLGAGSGAHTGRGTGSFTAMTCARCHRMTSRPVSNVARPMPLMLKQFVTPVKSMAQQAVPMTHGTRGFCVRQQTPTCERHPRLARRIRRGSPLRCRMRCNVSHACME